MNAEEPRTARTSRGGQVTCGSSVLGSRRPVPDIGAGPPRVGKRGQASSLGADMPEAAPRASRGRGLLAPTRVGFLPPPVARELVNPAERSPGGRITPDELRQARAYLLRVAELPEPARGALVVEGGSTVVAERFPREDV